MPSIHLLFLWHMHQPYYKNLVTGEYRLPWVRLHALKDYYGMVKLLDEFPGVHQTFNLVPSLMAQIQDYVSGNAQDPYFAAASRPAADLSLLEKEFVLTYFFQGNLQTMIGRYPRYRELWQKYQDLSGTPAKAAPLFTESDFTDLQVLSQIAWFDEFWLEDPPIRELAKKGRGYSLEDQQFVVGREKELLSLVLPEYAAAQRSGAIEISTSPFYHPILPLICDTDSASGSRPGVPLPKQRFRHPEDAREQIMRGVALHEQVFGMRPTGMWPSEGSVSNEALAIACQAGIEWAASDEGVLGRSLGTLFQRDGSGKLDESSADMLYRFYRWEQGGSSIHMIFRDHAISDLIGFVYSGMPAKEAVLDFVGRIKASCAPLLAKGRDVTVPIILDGENAWETYPLSGREFLRRLYQAILDDKMFEALTVSEALKREKSTATLSSIVPGSWINANFDVWIGAREDNVSWDYLSAARDFYSRNAQSAPKDRRELAFEELLIAEGSDWNWWYGPEHHSANDREFDDLYRKHLANVYYALGADPPTALAHPIIDLGIKLPFSPQTAYISPRVGNSTSGYFDWLGSATYVADRTSSAMHGKVLLLDTGYAGIDDQNLYARVDLMEKIADPLLENARLVATITSVPPAARADGEGNYKLEIPISPRALQDARFSENGHSPQPLDGIKVALRRESSFECKIPLSHLNARLGTVLHLRFSLWRGQALLDALPQEGFMDVQVVSAQDLAADAYAKP